METKEAENLAFSIWRLEFSNQMSEVRGRKWANN